MPTHQGKSQTDITLGGEGSSITEDTSFEFAATHGLGAQLQVKDLAPGTDRQYTAYELVVNDPAGGPVATMAARYKAWVDRGSASGQKTIDITNTFDPQPDGASPTWPSTADTVAERSWKVDCFDAAGNLFGTAQANWQLRSTVQTGAKVIQTVVDQDSEMLRVHLVYLAGDVVLLDTVVTMTGAVAVKGRVSADPPDVTDRFIP
ncbi:MAG: hypothetical protein KC457_34790 [Myxococcales bacterium]|nr:hypothetical protein [Myxococcales bacterium]